MSNQKNLAQTLKDKIKSVESYRVIQDKKNAFRSQSYKGKMITMDKMNDKLDKTQKRLENIKSTIKYDLVTPTKNVYKSSSDSLQSIADSMRLKVKNRKAGIKEMLNNVKNFSQTKKRNITFKVIGSACLIAFFYGLGSSTPKALAGYFKSEKSN